MSVISVVRRDNGLSWCFIPICILMICSLTHMALKIFGAVPHVDIVGVVLDRALDKMCINCSAPNFPIVLECCRERG